MVLYKKKSSSLTEADQDHPEWGNAWVWVALDPITKLIIHAVVGKRTEQQAKLFIFGLVGKLSGPLPLFTSDELPHYKTALAECYSTLIPVPSTGKRGRPKNPIVQIEPELKYATIHKTRDKGRIVNLEQRILFGKEQDINKIWGMHYFQVHTISSISNDILKSFTIIRHHNLFIGYRPYLNGIF